MKKFIIVLSAFLPTSVAFAQFTGFVKEPLITISQTLARFESIINLTIIFIVGLAVFMIIYGIFGFVTHPADEEARAQGRSFIIWGIIAVFIMVSIWGIVNILLNSLATNNADGRNTALRDSLIHVTPLQETF